MHCCKTHEGGYGGDDQQQTDGADDGETVVADMKSESKRTKPIVPQKAPVTKKVPVSSDPPNLESNQAVGRSEEFTRSALMAKEMIIRRLD